MTDPKTGGDELSPERCEDVGHILVRLSELQKRVMISLLSVLVCSTLAIIKGFVLAVGAFHYSYTQILPIPLDFLTSRGFIPQHIGVLLAYRVSISFVLQILLIAVVLFQLPVVLLMVFKLELLNTRSALRGGPYVVATLLGLSAFLTSPDIVSQIGPALPLVGLYFMAIEIATRLRFGRPERDEP